MISILLIKTQLVMVCLPIANFDRWIEMEWTVVGPEFFRISSLLFMSVVSSRSRLIRTTVLVAPVAPSHDLAVPLRSPAMAT
jgi:hypothetical protein